MIDWKKITEDTDEIYDGKTWLVFFGSDHAEPCYWNLEGEYWVYAYDGDSPSEAHKPTHYVKWDPPQ